MRHGGGTGKAGDDPKPTRVRSKLGVSACIAGLTEYEEVGWYSTSQPEKADAVAAILNEYRESTVTLIAHCRVVIGSLMRAYISRWREAQVNTQATKAQASSCE